MSAAVDYKQIRNPGTESGFSVERDVIVIVVIGLILNDGFR